MQSGFSEKIWVNLLGFQLAWWVAVLAGAVAWPALAILVLLHIFLHRKPLTETKVILAVAVIGFTIDSLLMYVGVFIFAEVALLPPIWLFMLWLCFAATLRQGLRWFADKPLLSVLAGGVGGSLSYIGGAKLGAVTLGEPFLFSALLLVITWALLFPFLFLVVNKIEQVKEISHAS